MQKRIFKKRLFTVILASLMAIGLISETNYPENNAYAYDNSTKTVISMTSEGREQVRREEAAKRLEKIKQERERLEEIERRNKMPIEELITVVANSLLLDSFTTHNNISVKHSIQNLKNRVIVTDNANDKISRNYIQN